MRRVSSILLLVLCGSVGAADDLPAITSMQKTEELPLAGEYSAPFIGKFGCDGDGNVYGRQKRTRGWRDPVLRLKPDGEPIRYSITGVDVAGLREKAGGLDFFVSKDGEVSQIIQVPRTYDIYVAKWKKDGTFASAVKLQARFDPSGALAIFPSGEMLVSGFTAYRSDRPETAVNMLFDKNGKLVKEVVLEGDIPVENADAAYELQLENKSKHLSAIQLGGGVIGSDGNLYLLRRSLPARVFVISPSGELVRTLKIESGYPSLLPGKIAEHEGRLAIVFYNYDERDTVLALADGQTGETLQLFSVDRLLGPALACFGKDGFTFVSMRQRRLGLVRGAP